MTAATSSMSIPSALHPDDLELSSTLLDIRKIVVELRAGLHEHSRDLKQAIDDARSDMALLSELSA